MPQSSLSSSAANEDGFFRNQSNTVMGTVGFAFLPDIQPAPKIMTDITRPELDAKLELIEARMDTRVARIESLIEKVQTSADQISEDNKETRVASRNFKYWAMGIAVATVVGLYAANVSLTQTVIAAFEAGRNIGSPTPVPQKQSEQQQSSKK